MKKVEKVCSSTRGNRRTAKSTQKGELISMSKKRVRQECRDWNEVGANGNGNGSETNSNPLSKMQRKRKRHIGFEPKNSAQKQFVEDLKSADIIFCLGSAGTGKSYASVSMGVEGLVNGKYAKLVLVRPVVEACGEKIGFLPGSVEEKLNPYIQPVYDVLYEYLSPGEVDFMIAEKIIEISPLAYMRGRSLRNAYVILEEAQNTTKEQMQMFLTRLGENSKLVITGDLEQSDIRDQSTSGISQALDIFSDMEEIKFVYFDKSETLRHPLVQKIVTRYEDARNGANIKK